MRLNSHIFSGSVFDVLVLGVLILCIFSIFSAFLSCCQYYA